MKPARRIVFAAIAGVLAIGGTSALGFWQLRRAAGKEVLQREIERSSRAPPVTPSADALLHPDRLIYRHLQFRGRWLPDRVVYLDNRPQAGRAGFYVLMPLAIDRPGYADVIVNRGWLPRDFEVRTRIAPYRTPDDAVTITGVALAGEPTLLELAAPSDRRLGGIWQNFDFEAYARASGRKPARIIVRQDPSSSPRSVGDAVVPAASEIAAEADGLDRNWPDRGGALQSQIDRHHGYAFQWFALAASLAALLVYQLVRLVKHARKHPS